MEPERKDPEKEPQKVAAEPSLKGKVPLVKVEEATVEEGTPGELEAASGKNQLTCDGMRVVCSLPFPPALFSPLWGLRNFILRLIFFSIVFLHMKRVELYIPKSTVGAIVYVFSMASDSLIIFTK